MRPPFRGLLPDLLSGYCLDPGGCGHGTGVPGPFLRARFREFVGRLVPCDAYISRAPLNGDLVFCCNLVDGYEHPLGRYGRVLLGTLDCGCVIDAEGDRGVRVEVRYSFEPA